MIDTARQRENAVAGYIAAATQASLHTADPAGTGANEVTGGTPAYARQPVTWSAGAIDGTATSGILTFNVPPSTTIEYVGLWDASGNYLDKADSQATFIAQGVYRVTLTYSQD